MKPIGESEVVLESSHFLLGSCQVVLETGGPWGPDETISLSPGTVRSMASLVLSECVQQQGIGGFATAGLRNMINHLADISTVWNTPYRKPGFLKIIDTDCSITNQLKRILARTSPF